MSKSTDRIDAAGFQMNLTSQGWLQSLAAASLPAAWTGAGEPGSALLEGQLYLDDRPLPANWKTEEVRAEGHQRVFHGALEGIEIENTAGIDAVGPYWQVRLANRTGQGVVTRFDFRLVVLFSPQNGAHCTIPYCAGWTLPLASFETSDAFSLSYPAKAAMQWVDVYTAEQGLYFGVHDPLPLLKALSLQGSAGNPVLLWQFPDLDLSPGESLELPPVYLVPHGGDWHSGADIYRRWIDAHLRPSDPPAWYAELPAWAWVGLRGQHDAQIWHQASELPGLSALVAGCGLDLIQLTAYTEHGHDTLYPDYAPGESMGGEAGLRQAVEEIHRAGRRISIYTNGRVVDPASSLSPTERQAWSVKTAPQSGSFQESYGSVAFDVMCPGAAGWRDLFTRRLVELVAKYHLDGIYIDQVSAAPALPCYQRGHDHTAPNRAWACYREMLSSLRQAVNAAHPDTFLATEGVNDLLGQYFDSQQAHQDWLQPFLGKARRLDDLYRYTFPTQLLNSGCVTLESTGRGYLKLSHLTGSGFDFGIFDWSAVPASLCEEISFVLGWRRDYTAILQSPPIPVEAVPAGLKALAFAGDGELVVQLAWLPDKVDVTTPAQMMLGVPLPDGFHAREVRCALPGEERHVDWLENQHTLQLSLQFAELVGILVELQAEKKEPDG